MKQAGIIALISIALFLGIRINAATPALADKDAQNLIIKRLRAKGIAGVHEFYNSHLPLFDFNKTPRNKATRTAHQWLDSICQQRDCYASRLFWYTDLEEAKQVAQQQNKPILSLYLLGKLTDEYSCANSRFFRALLYPDPRVSALLREHFVLHWRTVREVPQLTIDFGDGRVLRNTITGNSVHYVLDAKGRIVDALPGLYGPEKFLELLTHVNPVAVHLGKFEGREHTLRLRNFHRMRLEAIDQRWQQFRGISYPDVVNSNKTDLESGEGLFKGLIAVQMELKELDIPTEPPKLQTIEIGPRGFPTAIEASAIALSKAIVERPAIPKVSSSLAPYKTLEQARREIIWHELAVLEQNKVILSEASKQFILRHVGGTEQSKKDLLANFARAAAIDTLKNEYQLHRTIHQWFCDKQNRYTLEQLNERIYSELFLTPQQDEWIGLNPVLAYGGLEGNGVLSRRSVAKIIADDEKA